MSAECLWISNTQLQEGTEIPASSASFSTLLLSSEFNFFFLPLIFSTVADVACINKKKALNATSIRKHWIHQHWAWIAEPGYKCLVRKSLNLLSFPLFGFVWVLGFFLNKVLAFWGKKNGPLCYENRTFHEQFPLSWKGINTEQCLSCSSTELVAEISRAVLGFREPPNHSRTEKRIHCHQLSLTPGWKTRRLCLLSLPSRDKEVGRSWFVWAMCQSDRKKKHLFACGLGSVQPPVLCGKPQGASEHPFVLQIPKLKHLTLADNFEIFISIHLC